MPSPLANTRADLDAIVEEIDRKLEQVYRLSPGKSRAEVWASLTSAALKLAAPEDQDYLYERLYAIFKASQARPLLAVSD
ncbi:hypothetical protein OVA13_06720 [Pseudoxanthomonas sp. SL93]|uniref:hypothetical protein n=1 Tax=Pseudoxanthomonas sp. SL93 TaxID=2995142 RepID=UPI002270F257|nr:hypothetical protein [Pseudoxanthomonas sp. SL93]WAC64452.1 hypothetical protein OVA13_06720 [Pseudoxanthomonas sp. SL93]